MSPGRRDFLRGAAALGTRVFAARMAALGTSASAARIATLGTADEAAPAEARLFRTQAPMLTRAIPSTGERIPAIGMGTWQTFDPPSISAESLAPLRDVLRIFQEAGGRLIDSSPMYGKSESVAGRLSTELGINSELFIATKVWTTGEQAGIRQMRTSMSELGRERLELMQIHNLVDWQTHLRTLRRWKDEGIVKYIGITHYTSSALDDLARIIEREPLDFVQLAYSIAVRDAERRVLPLAADRGVAVLVNRPYEGGGLFSTVRGRELPEPVRAFAGSWGQAFLKFILANEAVTAVIPATSNPAHMRDNVQAGTGPLPTPEQRAALLRAVGR